MSNQNATLVKKIAVKSVCGNIEPPTEQVAIMRIIGSVSKLEVIETTYGESTKFKGDFLATNLDSGELFRSSVAFLPSIVEGLVANSFDEENSPLEFAFDIFVSPSDNGEKKYQYTAKPLIEAAKSDPMMQFMSKVNETAPLVLNAPSEKTAIEAPKEEVKETKKTTKKKS